MGCDKSVLGQPFEMVEDLDRTWSWALQRMG